MEDTQVPIQEPTQGTTQGLNSQARDERLLQEYMEGMVEDVNATADEAAEAPEECDDESEMDDSDEVDIGDEHDLNGFEQPDEERPLAGQQYAGVGELPTLHIGGRYHLEELQAYLTINACLHKKGLKRAKKDKQRATWRCKQYVEYGADGNMVMTSDGKHIKMCHWTCTAKHLGDNDWEIVNFVDKHDCDGHRRTWRNPANNHEFLCNVLPAFVRRNLDPKVKDTKAHLNHWLGMDVSTKAVGRALREVKNSYFGDEAESYKNVRGYCDRMLELDPECRVSWKNKFGGQFERVFIMPSCSPNVWRHTRPILALDGTHTRGTYQHVLLLATALDANNHSIILARSVVPSETLEEWQWFLEELKSGLNGGVLGGPLLEEELLVISDRNEGLLSAIERVLPRVHQRYCIVHLKKNAARSRTSAKLWGKAFGDAYTTHDRNKFTYAMGELKRIAPDVGAYLELEEQTPEHWANSWFPWSSFGTYTSNFVETQNNRLKSMWKCPIIMMLSILHTMQQGLFFRMKDKDANNCNTPFPPTLMKKWDKMAEDCGLLYCVQASRRLGTVSGTSTSGIPWEHTVTLDHTNLPMSTCTCGRMQEFRFPCIHAYTFAMRLTINPARLVHKAYSTDEWRATYDVPMMPMRLGDLVEEPNTIPPPKRPRTSSSTSNAGRPQENRFASQGEDVSQGGRVSRPPSQRKCSFCKNTGHNAQTCEAKKREDAREVARDAARFTFGGEPRAMPRGRRGSGSRGGGSGTATSFGDVGHEDPFAGVGPSSPQDAFAGVGPSSPPRGRTSYVHVRSRGRKMPPRRGGL